MLLSTRDYLSVVAPYIPPELVSADTVEVISNVAAALPPCSNFGLECRLGSPAPHADFLVAVIPSDGSRSAWAGENPLTALPQAVRTEPSWRKIQSFLADWHANAAGFEPIHDAWLELDIDPHRPALPEPSFFFGFDDSVAANHPHLVETLVERLLGSPLADRRRELLRRCFSRLPPEGIVFQVGVMLSRGTDDVRLCTRRMTPQQITGYLARVGWPGSVAPLGRYLRALGPMVDAISLDLSLGESALPQIGLECSIRDGAAGRARMASLLEHLVASSACLPEKRDALFRWLGYCTEVADRPRWPAHLLEASTALGDDVYGAFARTLNHVKITYQSGEPIAAKAYLGVRHLWCRASSGRAA
jgi:hypothetical protein